MIRPQLIKASKNTIVFMLLSLFFISSSQYMVAYANSKDKKAASYETPPIDLVMLKIPAGKFTMGSNESKDEKPVHTVYLDEYYIGKYEVTQDQYKNFIVATGHRKPPGNWKPEEKADYPVTNVDWSDAAAFCKWAGGRLPTEAEWEKASRGTDGRKYPWGNKEPDFNLLNFNNNIKETTLVGSYPAGATQYGIMDMAGNVWEWCSDWYENDYYENSPAANPKGPKDGLVRSFRGGCFYDVAEYVRASNRFMLNPDSRSDNLGFRLVVDK